jgi:hypothetical protein
MGPGGDEVGVGCHYNFAGGHCIDRHYETQGVIPLAWPRNEDPAETKTIGGTSFFLSLVSSPTEKYLYQLNNLIVLSLKI